jgi:hypothetical protein
MKKQAYMKPAMRVVKFQQQYIICTSSGGSQSLQIRSGSGNQINSEEDVW